MNKTIPVYAARLKERQTPVAFREIANECDGFDKAVDEVNENRKLFWAEVRKVIAPGDIKPLKAAIKARRKRRADLDGEEAFDARVFEILAEIEAGTIPALTRGARDAEGIGESDTLPPHDSDGVIIEEPEAGSETVEGKAAPASGDAVEMPPQFPARLAADASPTIPQPAAGLPSAAAPVELSPLPDIDPGAPFELEDIPPGLDRRPKVAA